MEFLKIAKKDLRAIRKNKFVALSIVAILVVPMLYSLLYLDAFKDPYAKLADVPVAVVNKDNGAILDNENVNYGQDVVDELKGNSEMGWRFADEKDALEGLEGDKYYAVVEIPENFSSNVIAAKDGTPKVADIKFTCNDKKNFLAAQINSKVQSELSASITESISSNYVTVAFDNLYKAKDGMVQAADGSTQIKDGLAELNGKIPELKDGVNQLTTGSNTLTDAQQTLNNGSTTLQTGLNTLNSKLNEGKGQIDALNNGADAIVNNTEALLNGGNYLKSINGNVTNAYSNLMEGSSQVNGGVNQVVAGAEFTNSEIEKIAYNLTVLVAKNPELAKDPNMQKVISSLSTLNSKKDEMETGLSALSQGTNKLNQGMIDFNEKGLKPYISGTNTFVDNAIIYANGSSQVAQGSKQLIGNVSDVTEAVGQLSAGANSLTSGSNSILEGQVKLNEGINELHSQIPALSEGVTMLNDGSIELSEKLTDGAEEMDNGLVNSSEVMGEFVSKPINLEATAINPIPNYGTGFAPYFIPLSLWIGAVMMFFVIKADVSEEDKNTSKLSKVLGKFVTFATVGILQALLVSFVVVAFLGIHPTSLVAFVSTNVILSLAFVGIVQCFIFLLGDAGRLVSIVLLILQLTACGGTFPLEVVPNFFKVLNPFMPFTYAVEALREVISATTINYSVLFKDFAILLVALVVFLGVCTLLKDKGERLVEKMEAAKA